MHAHALLLAVACLFPPSFGTTGPDCVLTDEPCRCSEALWWPPAPNALWYEVQRKTVSTGVTLVVGDTKRHRVAIPAGDDALRYVSVTHWLPEWDSPPVQVGVLYEYRYRSCSPTNCSAYSAPIRYAGIPMACYEGGREVACYAGDSIIAR